MPTSKELRDTARLMISPNYKERFYAEYCQLCIRIESLENMLNLWDNGQLDFVPTCPYDLLKAQLHAMYSYRYLLMQRAEIENIDLNY